MARTGTIEIKIGADAARFRKALTAMNRNLHRADRIRKADAYLNARTGCYEMREHRYLAAVSALLRHGLDDTQTVMDVGAGWTEFDYCLRTRGDFKGRYIPVDACIDGIDLESWVPPRSVEWFLALEVIEHVRNPYRLVKAMMDSARCGVIVSTPNPLTTSVLKMDATHKREIYPETLEAWGFDVAERSFYGKPQDSLFGVWCA